MRKILVLVLIGLASCSERGCSNAQMLNNNVRPYTVVSKSAPFTRSNGSGCWVRLQGKDGNMFELDDCDMCRSYEVGDTIK